MWNHLFSSIQFYQIIKYHQLFIGLIMKSFNTKKLLFCIILFKWEIVFALRITNCSKFNYNKRSIAPNKQENY